ncbi:MAG: protein tyrosine phosphatase [Roseiflexaceae bacterium]|nr:protein tyrosine phosphatase [Roseiflexaceae bacterium]
METPLSLAPLATITLLANGLRWNILKTLAQSDMPLGALSDALGFPPDVLRAALVPLREAGLILERQSDTGADEIFLRTDLQRLRDLYMTAGADMHPAVVDATIDLEPPSEQRPRILFLCTRNSARSQIAEALLRTLSKGTIDVMSAGAQPGDVHPMTKQVLAPYTDVEQLRAKPVSTFTGQAFDYVITVCDKAREVCPTFPGATQMLHWSTPDPVAVEGTIATKQRAFNATITELTNRIRYLLIFIERDQSAARAGAGAGIYIHDVVSSRGF